MRVADRAIVGGCGFKHAPRDGRVEIGYAVAPSCRMQGIATTAVRELVRSAFASGDVHEVLAQINPDNAASARVAHKLGFDARGKVIDEDDEPLVQSLLRKKPAEPSLFLRPELHPTCISCLAYIRKPCAK